MIYETNNYQELKKEKDVFVVCESADDISPDFIRTKYTTPDGRVAVRIQLKFEAYMKIFLN